MYQSVSIWDYFTGILSPRLSPNYHPQSFTTCFLLPIDLEFEKMVEFVNSELILICLLVLKICCTTLQHYNQMNYTLLHCTDLDCNRCMYTIICSGLSPLVQLQIVLHIWRTLIRIRLGHKCRCTNKQANKQLLNSFGKLNAPRENFVELCIEWQMSAEGWTRAAWIIFPALFSFLKLI